MRPTLAVAVLFLACVGQPGPVGPTGPAGTTGAQGPPGPTGSNGTSITWTDSDTPTTHAILNENTVITANLGGRAGLPADATAAYLEVEGCRSPNGGTSFVMWVESKPRRILVTQACGTSYYPPGNVLPVWVALDASQSVTIGVMSINFGAVIGTARVTLLGWMK